MSPKSSHSSTAGVFEVSLEILKKLYIVITYIKKKYYNYKYNRI